MASKTQRTASEDLLSDLVKIGQEQQDKRFVAQVMGLKSSMEKNDLRGILGGCRSLWKIALDGEFLPRVEPFIRPLFESTMAKFEKSRAAMLRTYRRLASVAKRVGHLEKLRLLTKIEQRLV